MVNILQNCWSLCAFVWQLKSMLHNINFFLDSLVKGDLREVKGVRTLSLFAPLSDHIHINCKNEGSQTGPSENLLFQPFHQGSGSKILFSPVSLSLQDLKKPFDRAWRDYESRLWVMITLTELLSKVQRVFTYTHKYFYLTVFAVSWWCVCACKCHYHAFRNQDKLLSRIC